MDSQGVTILKTMQLFLLHFFSLLNLSIELVALSNANQFATFMWERVYTKLGECTANLSLGSHYAEFMRSFY